MSKYLYRVVDRDGKNPESDGLTRLFGLRRDAITERARLNERARFNAEVARQGGMTAAHARDWGYPFRIVRVADTAWEEVKS